MSHPRHTLGVFEVSIPQTVRRELPGGGLSWERAPDKRVEVLLSVGRPALAVLLGRRAARNRGGVSKLMGGIVVGEIVSAGGKS